jgi:hypothetical protein
MLLIPLQAVPNQTLQVQLGGQNCTLNVYQFLYGLFIDVLVNNQVICTGIICQNLNRIVRYAYLGFVGDFTFFDTQGETDPIYTGLGSRYQLFYLSPSDALLAAAQASLGG